MKTKEWIQWLGATLIAGLTLSAFAFTNFQTKEEAGTVQDMILKRLDRIEEKLDTFILKEAR